MALTQVSSKGIKDATLLNEDVNASANIAGSKLADNSISLAKLEHGDANNDGKFLRANNGADPSYESIPSPAITAIASASNNRVITSNGGTTVNAEPNLIYDGLRLGINRTPTTNADYPLQIQSANATAFAHFKSSQSAGDDPNQYGGLVGLLNDDMYLWGRESGSRIILGAHNGERARIDASGNMKIGETNSGAVRLSLTQGSSGGLMISQGSGTTPTNGQTIGDIGFSSYSDAQTNSSSEAMIRAVAAGNHSGSSAPTDLLFFTKHSSTGPGSSPGERMRINNEGRIGMGVNPSHGRVHSSPIGFNPWGNTWLSGASFVAAGGYGGGISILDGSKGWSFSGYDSGADIYLKHHTGTTNAGQGGVYINDGGTSWQSASDERDKENFVNITDAVTKVKTLRTVIGNYIWKPEVRTPFLIAQDVQAVLPEAVTVRNKNEEEEDRLGMSYQSIIPLLTAALKEAITKIETLETKVAALEAA